ncbi:MAG: type VI secretion system baseplate subunit TssE [Gammaproteobacteria bacterium]
MRGRPPGFFERLFDTQQAGATLALQSVDELKDAVARDLESLLNTRTIVEDADLKGFDACAASLLTYGLTDFAGRSLSSPTDRAHICACLEQAILRHEPRLKNVKAALEVREDAINSIQFSISAMLVAGSELETVSFDANLQPSSLHYTISRARRSAARPG